MRSETKAAAAAATIVRQRRGTAGMESKEKSENILFEGRLIFFFLSLRKVLFDVSSNNKTHRYKYAISAGHKWMLIIRRDKYTD